MKVTVGPDAPPPVVPFYAAKWERGIDPWHRDAFPDEFKIAAPNQSYPRKGGWYLVDWIGNVIGFAADGSEIEMEEA